MRLQSVQHGPHVPPGRQFPDIVPTLRYRAEFFGNPFGLVLQDVLKGPSAWTSGERELFAAFVSFKNHCMFWTTSHGAVASKELGDDVVRAVLQDWQTAPVSDRMRAMIAYLEKLTLAPASIGPLDIVPLREVGLDDEAIEDAIMVATLFNVIDRVADALDFAVPPSLRSAPFMPQ